MKLTLEVLQERQETWFRGKRDERAVRVLTLFDTDTVAPMPQTIDYTLSDEEAKNLPQGTLKSKVITVYAKEFRVANGGRLSIRGLLEVPKK